MTGRCRLAETSAHPESGQQRPREGDDVSRSRSGAAGAVRQTVRPEIIPSYFAEDKVEVRANRHRDIRFLNAVPPPHRLPAGLRASCGPCPGGVKGPCHARGPGRANHIPQTHDGWLHFCRQLDGSGMPKAWLCEDAWKAGSQAPAGGRCRIAFRMRQRPHAARGVHPPAAAGGNGTETNHQVQAADWLIRQAAQASAGRGPA
jgi:hypothetical protein